MQIPIFVLVLGFAIACDIYDVVMTEKGIRAGVGVEGNTWLVGTKPTALKLYLRDSLVLAMTVAPSIFAALIGRPELFYGFLIGPFVFGVKHIQGGRQWRWALNNPTKKLPEPGSAWQQFLGTWV